MNVESNIPTQQVQEEATRYREGPIARSIEKKTARVPSDLFLWAAGAAIVASLALEIAGLRDGRRGKLARAPLATFVGLWVPSLLLLGVYNKIVKVAGSDRTEHLRAAL